MPTKTKEVSDQTVQRALNALDGMRQIVKNEMLQRGVYLSDVVDEDLKASGAICGGRKACAIGSVMVGAGVPSREIENQDPSDRDDILRNRHGLRLAVGALNQASKEIAERRNLNLDNGRTYVYPDALEELFENHYDGTSHTPFNGYTTTTRKIVRADLLRVIKRAEKLIQKGEAELRPIERIEDD